MRCLIPFLILLAGCATVEDPSKVNPVPVPAEVNLAEVGKGLDVIDSRVAASVVVSRELIQGGKTGQADQPLVVTLVWQREKLQVRGAFQCWKFLFSQRTSRLPRLVVLPRPMVASSGTHLMKIRYGLFNERLRLSLIVNHVKTSMKPQFIGDATLKLKMKIL